MNDRQRISAVYERLLATYGPQKCFLDHTTPFQLLVATILSAQCTDRTVNKVTPALFKRWPDVFVLANADLSELEQTIHACGFYHAKAKNIIAACQAIVTEFNGTVPNSMEELTRLPGVGRKTANVVLGDSFGLPGFPVDTHVTRLAQRMGLSVHADPVHIETDLCKHTPPENWAQFSHLLIIHGRTFCKAQKPDCAGCPAAELCKKRKTLSKNKGK